MTIRLASWYRPPWLRADDSPLGSYPREAMTWLPERDDDLEVIGAAYAEYALLIVKADRCSSSGRSAAVLRRLRCLTAQ